MTSQIQTITGNSKLNAKVSRSLTRLKSVFVSLSKTLVATNAPAAALGMTTLTHPSSKEWNSFYSSINLMKA